MLLSLCIGILYLLRCLVIHSCQHVLLNTEAVKNHHTKCLKSHYIYSQIYIKRSFIHVCISAC
jgi:hypothetical protein